MTRINTQSISRRIRMLEAVLVTGPSTEDKWAAIHQSAVALMSKADLTLLEEAALPTDAGFEMECKAQHDTAVAKWERACDQAFAESDVRFRIEELDEMLDAL